MRHLFIKIRIVLKYWLVVPHLIVYRTLNSSQKELIQEDIKRMNQVKKTTKRLDYALLYYKPYRNVFYQRIGDKACSLLKFLLPEYPLFFISPNCELGGGIFVLNHPYGTIINARRIGRNFNFCQLTTIGNKQHGRNDLIPVIGDNVSLGANVNIVGNITIGNNVVVGAGSVVTKDVPDNSIVAGNPARVVKELQKVQ